MDETPNRPITYAFLLQQRYAMVAEWYAVKELIEIRCADLNARKYYHKDGPVVNLARQQQEHPIDIDLMPVPALYLAFPPLR